MLYLALNEALSGNEIIRRFDLIASPTGAIFSETLCLFSNCVDQMKFVIHNRWGQKVFETEDINSCWDGSFNRQEAQSGVYAFNVYLRQLDGTVINKTGTISLVK